MNILSVVVFLVVFAGPAAMVIGLIVMFASLLRRRVGSPTAARLLFAGPGISLIGVAILVAEIDFDALVRVPLILLLLGSGIGVCAVAFRARIRFAPIKPT